MLVRAQNHKETLKRMVLKVLDDPYYDYLWSNYVDFDSDLKNTNYYSHQWVSVEGGCNVVGFFCAEIDRTCNYVKSLKIINFDKSKKATFSLDLKEFFLRLFFRYNYNKMNFSVVVGSRNEKIYDKFVNRYGGRVVGTFYNDRMLQDGSIRDMKHYEINREDFLDKAMVLHSKQILKMSWEKEESQK